MKLHGAHGRARKIAKRLREAEHRTRVALDQHGAQSLEFRKALQEESSIRLDLQQAHDDIERMERRSARRVVA